MAVVRASVAVTSVTLATSGVVATSADSGYNAGSSTFVCTAAEASALCQMTGDPVVSDTVSLTTGTVDINVPGNITTTTTLKDDTITPALSSITINAQVYNAVGSKLPAVAAVDAKALLAYSFKLVTG